MIERILWFVLLWPRLSWHDYQIRKFWAIAAEQERVARRLEWRLKQLP